MRLPTRYDSGKPGHWIEQTEGARFWLGVLTAPKNRGLEDEFFVCCDGLTGLPQTIEAAFPKATVQTCIVHMIRASLRYVSTTDRKELVMALRTIYSARERERRGLGFRSPSAAVGQAVHRAPLAPTLGTTPSSARCSSPKAPFRPTTPSPRSCI